MTKVDAVDVDFQPTCNPPDTARRASEAELEAVAVSGLTGTRISGSDGIGLQNLNCKGGKGGVGYHPRLYVIDTTCDSCSLCVEANELARCSGVPLWGSTGVPESVGIVGLARDIAHTLALHRFLTRLCAGNSPSMSASIVKGVQIISILLCWFPDPDGRFCIAAANDASVESACRATAFIVKARRTSPCSWPPPRGGGDLNRM